MVSRDRSDTRHAILGEPTGFRLVGEGTGTEPPLDCGNPPRSLQGQIGTCAGMDDNAVRGGSRQDLSLATNAEPFTALKASLADIGREPLCGDLRLHDHRGSHLLAGRQRGGVRLLDRRHSLVAGCADCCSPPQHHQLVEGHSHAVVPDR